MELERHFYNCMQLLMITKRELQQLEQERLELGKRRRERGLRLSETTLVGTCFEKVTLEVTLRGDFDSYPFEVKYFPEQLTCESL